MRRFARQVCGSHLELGEDGTARGPHTAGLRPSWVKGLAPTEDPAETLGGGTELTKAEVRTGAASSLSFYPSASTRPGLLASVHIVTQINTHRAASLAQLTLLLAGALVPGARLCPSRSFHPGRGLSPGVQGKL